MNPFHENGLLQTRRELIFNTAKCLGGAALGSLMAPNLISAPRTSNGIGGLAGLPHFAPKAKRVIMLFFSGGPSHIDMFDYKPRMRDFHGTELPDSIRKGQRITGMTSGQKSFPCVAPMFKFKRHGAHGTWVSELLPNIAGIVDDVTLIKSMHTEAINHDPAITFFQSGHQQPGRPSLGSWLSYGLGSETDNLPSFVVMLSRNTFSEAQPLYDRLWGGGFLPSKFQGVKFRSQGDPVLYLKDPTGLQPTQIRPLLDQIAKLNRLRQQEVGDPEISARIAQYEMAYRMQTSVPELADLSDEPESTFKLYGDDAKTPGTHAANCLMARRLAERGVRFIQVFHRGWDHHGGVKNGVLTTAKHVDKASAALIRDLKDRGMLDDTLVIWGGEFGRTPMAQGSGRDHHMKGFSFWLAGGGIRGGISHGNTDDLGYHSVEDVVTVHDFHATMLHLLGVNHEKFTFKFQGLDFRLTGVEEANVLKPLLA